MQIPTSDPVSLSVVAKDRFPVVDPRTSVAIALQGFLYRNSKLLEAASRFKTDDATLLYQVKNSVVDFCVRLACIVWIHFETR